VDPTTINVESGSGGLIYVLTFTNTNGVLSDFNVIFDPATVTAAADPAVGVNVSLNPKIVVADPVSGIYRFYFEYNNSVGDHRCITDQYIKY
jgi:hypothetical protein